MPPQPAAPVSLAQPLGTSANNHNNERSSINTLVSNDEKAVDQIQDPEKAAHIVDYEDNGASSQSSDQSHQGGVDVEKAKAEFHALERRLSQKSSLYRAQSRASNPSAADLEKADEEEEFNLFETIRGDKDVRDREGFTHKEVGVVWENLKVIGGGGMSKSFFDDIHTLPLFSSTHQNRHTEIHIRTFPNAIMEQFIMPPLNLLKLFGLDLMSPKPRDILRDFSGCLKPGEMCLVVARPGGGASTFLKAITNNRESYQKVEGEVIYQGLSADEMKKKYAGEVLYSMEDDVHLPTLTVKQTIETALRVKTPGRLPAGVTEDEFREATLETLLKMLNITHTKNTLVGNEFIRGVSGGERKRVSIAEAFCGQGCVFSWDNSTRGLDASTALDYAKSIRTVTDIKKMASFVSLYQAGEGIYDQFDKVLVIDKGHQVYFGPAKEARQYMLSLGWKDKPRQTTADFLTGCTDEHEREFAEGRDASNTPTTSEALEKAYLESDVYRRMQAEAQAYKAEMIADHEKTQTFRDAVIEGKRKFVGKKSPYTVSFFTQVYALFLRQLILNLQDKLSIYSSFFTSIAIAFISGSCFYNLPESAAGAFTRGGVLFIAMLFNALNAFSELPTQMQGRPIMYKQVQYRFYRPGALSIAQTLADCEWQVLNFG